MPYVLVGWAAESAKQEQITRHLAGHGNHLCKVQRKGEESACCVPLLLPNLHGVRNASGKHAKLQEFPLPDLSTGAMSESCNEPQHHRSRI